MTLIPQRSFLLLLCGAFVLVACGGNAQPLIVTEQPTATLTDTTTPPVAAVVQQVVNPTATSIPTQIMGTATSGPSPTALLPPTLSPVPRTVTPTAAPTSARLAVEYFTTDSEFVTPGENVRLFWGVRGADRARIYRLDENDERIFRWDVPATGQITVATRDEDRDAAHFLITAESDESSVEQLLLIPLQCGDLWFFDPAPDACAAGDPQLSNQAEQSFERGRMIWVEALDQIFVVFEDGDDPGWASYPDDFNEGDVERDDTLIPPPGLSQPVRGFGLIWRENPRVQERLGWANTSEVAFEGMYQSDAAEPEIATTYLRMRDGGIIALNAQTSSWEVLPPPEPTSDSPSPTPTT